MFVREELRLPADFAASRDRLSAVALSGTLLTAAQAASDESVTRDHHTGLTRVGPLGPVRGLSRVVEVQFGDLVEHEDSAQLALRWEVAGPGGGLFPVLDADISITRVGEHSTVLSLAGTYRPPLGLLGAGLDRIVLGQVAMATVRSLLRCLSEAIVNHGTEPELSPVP
ncbi:MAG TPA: hypothetical protein VGS19_10810 [Streptosporangiaceae bacterium]|nr:hypothetical protein [Streptosporangiaceae bacterium]